MAAYTYTETDLANVRAAKIALATGTRKVSLSMGDKSIAYAQSDMKSLELLEQTILAEVQTTIARPRFFLASTEKGL